MHFMSGEAEVWHFTRKRYHMHANGTICLGHTHGVHADQCGTRHKILMASMQSNIVGALTCISCTKRLALTHEPTTHTMVTYRCVKVVLLASLINADALKHQPLAVPRLQGTNLKQGMLQQHIMQSHQHESAASAQSPSAGECQGICICRES